MFKLITAEHSKVEERDVHLMACLIIMSWKAASLSKRPSSLGESSSASGQLGEVSLEVSDYFRGKTCLVRADDLID